METSTKKLILFGIIVLLLISIVTSKQIDEISKNLFSEDETLKIKDFGELKDKFKIIEPINYQEEDNIVILHINVDEKELKILSTTNNINKIIK